MKNEPVYEGGAYEQEMSVQVILQRPKVSI